MLAREIAALHYPGPVRRLRRILWQSYYHFMKDDAFTLAGNIAYMAIFSVFPFLIFLIAIAGMLGHGEAASRSIELAMQVMPPDVAESLRPAIDEVVSGPSRSLVTFSILVTIWTASSGVESLRHALNRAYDVKDPPSYWRSRLQSILITIVGAIVLLAATLLLIIIPITFDVATFILDKPIDRDTFYASEQYLVGIGLLLVLLMVFYKVLPNERLYAVEIVPGALLAWVIWVAAQYLYTLYIRTVPSYSVTYGSLGGVIVTLLFFYISALLFIFGAEFNSVLKRRRENREPL
ncbi:MAG: YihY/virulence factor BrkB family protein [Geminicoccaceae bacterium]